MRRRLDQSKPDVLVLIGSDHLNQWFMDNMPPFLVGKARKAAGPFRSEMEMFGLPPYEANIDEWLAKEILSGSYDRGVDLAFSDEFGIDHSFTVPLSYLYPEGGLPIVPFFTNTMALPIPPATRFYKVGEVLRTVLEELPSQQRVAVVSSGHLSIEVGGPRMGAINAEAGRPDPTFDDEALRLLRRGDVDGLLRHATLERMLQAGNVTPGFLNFVMLAGVARGAGAQQAQCRGFAPFLSWDVPETGDRR